MSNPPLRLADFWRAGLPSFCTAANRRPAALAARNPFRVPPPTSRSVVLRRPIRSISSEPAKPVEGPKADLGSLFGEVHKGCVGAQAASSRHAGS